MYQLSNIYDYYFMASMQYEAENIISQQEWPTRPQEKFLEKLNYAMKELEYGLCNVIADYLTLACFGEMRHARSAATAYIRNIPISGSRSDAYEVAQEYDPISILERAVQLFRGYQWASSFGGESWAHIAEFTLQYRLGKITSQFFFDHVVDLAHNGGFAFDKRTALEMAGLRVNISQDALREFLNVKTFNATLLTDDESLSPNKYLKTTTATRSLVKSFYRIFRNGEEMNSRWQYTEGIWPEYHIFEWGDTQVDAPYVDPEYVETCAHCGCHVNKEAAHYAEGEAYCYGCYKSNFWKCQWCGVAHANAVEPVKVNGSKWCERCAREVARKCDHCGELYSKYDLSHYNGQRWCNSCIFQEKYGNQAEGDQNIPEGCAGCSAVALCMAQGKFNHQQEDLSDLEAILAWKRVSQARESREESRNEEEWW